MTAAFVLTVASVLPASNAAAAASMSRPVWTASDHWTYRVELFDRAGLAAQGTMDASVLGDENLTVRGVVYPTYHVRITTFLGPVAPYSGSNQTSVSDEWVTMDLVEVRTVEVTGSGLNLVTREWTSVPPGDVPWPLTDGLHWNWTRTESLNTTTAGGETNTSAEITRHYGVQSNNISVILAAGVFEVVHVTESVTPAVYNETYWSPKVGHWVEQISSEDYGYFMKSRLQLIAYSYQAGREIPASSPTLNLAWIALGFAVVAVAVVVLVRSRLRHRPAMTPPGSWPDGGSSPQESVETRRPPLRP